MTIPLCQLTHWYVLSDNPILPIDKKRTCQLPEWLNSDKPLAVSFSLSLSLSFSLFLSLAPSPPCVCSVPHHVGTMLEQREHQEPRSLLVTWNEQQLGETTCTHSQTKCIRRVTVCTCPVQARPQLKQRCCPYAAGNDTCKSGRFPTLSLSLPWGSSHSLAAPTHLTDHYCMIPSSLSGCSAALGTRGKTYMSDEGSMQRWGCSGEAPW